MEYIKNQVVLSIRDVVVWFGSCVVGRILNSIDLRLALSIAYALGKATAPLNPVRIRYQKKVEKILLSPSNAAGYDLCASLPVQYCERLREASLGNVSSLEGLLSLEGRENLDHVLAEGKGAILATTHFGAHILGFNYLALCGYPIHIFRAVAKRPGGRLTGWLKRRTVNYRLNLFQGTPAKTIPTKPGQKKKIILESILTKGQVVGITPDGGVSREFYNAPFLKGELRLATGFARLAMTTEAPIVPFFCIREGKKYRIVLEKPIYVNDTDGVGVFEAIDCFSHLFSQYLNNYPGQWNLLDRLDLRPLDTSRWQLMNPGRANNNSLEL